MMNYFFDQFGSRTIQSAVAFFLGTALFLACGSPAATQQKDKKKKNAPQAADNTPIIPMGDEQAVDYTISEMLGAWQIGDIEKLRKDYADDPEDETYQALHHAFLFISYNMGAFKEYVKKEAEKAAE